MFIVRWNEINHLQRQNTANLLRLIELIANGRQNLKCLMAFRDD